MGKSIKESVDQLVREAAYELGISRYEAAQQVMTSVYHFLDLPVDPIWEEKEEDIAWNNDPWLDFRS